MLDRRFFISTVDELVNTHGSRLKALCGQPVRATWVAWDEADDAWFPDEAVILGVGSTHLEIVFWKLNEVAVTWNKIDTSARPAWVSNWDEGFRLRWRQDALPALRRVVGQTITGVSVVEHLLRTKVIDDRNDPTRVGQEHQNWILHALEFDLSEGQLQVFNALDENGVTDTPPSGPLFRRIQLR